MPVAFRRMFLNKDCFERVWMSQLVCGVRAAITSLLFPQNCLPMPLAFPATYLRCCMSLTFCAPCYPHCHPPHSSPHVLPTFSFHPHAADTTITVACTPHTLTSFRPHPATSPSMLAAHVSFINCTPLHATDLDSKPGFAGPFSCTPRRVPTITHLPPNYNPPLLEQSRPQFSIARQPGFMIASLCVSPLHLPLLTAL